MAWNDWQVKGVSGHRYRARSPAQFRYWRLPLADVGTVGTIAASTRTGALGIDTADIHVKIGLS
jgi:hypothetical protein